MELVAGAKVAGKYELERRIGVGGMGEVWSAVQSPTRKRVALKFLKPSKDESQSEAEATRKRFLREARAACAVQHPNVVEIHDVLALEDGDPVMVMEYLSGETLEAKLARDGRMPLGELAAVLVRVVSAVGAAHALGIVHRDLKPDNIFLSETADGVDVKVLDFGIAKLTALDGDAAQTGGLTNTGAMLGTPYYMSPEQAFGERNIDHRADVWSLGIILYRAITGVLPTKADNIGQILKIIMMSEIRPIEAIAPGLPADLIALVGRMLAPKREDRPGSLIEVKGVLERYAGVEVLGFGAPAAPRSALTPALPSLDGVAASALPGLTPNNGLSTGGVATGSRQAPGRRPIALIAGSIFAVAVIGGIAMFARGTGTPSAASSLVAATGDAPAVATPAPTSSQEVATLAPSLTASGASTAPAASAAPPSASAMPSAAPSATPAPTGATPRLTGPLPPKHTPTAEPSAPPAPAPSPQGGPSIINKPVF